jgi:hypothetical protein
VTPVSDQDARLLHDDELDAVSGGTDKQFTVHKLMDASSPK